MKELYTVLILLLSYPVLATEGPQAVALAHGFRIDVSDTPEYPDNLHVTDTPSRKLPRLSPQKPDRSKLNPVIKDSLVKIDTGLVIAENQQEFTESSIPPHDVLDTMLILPFSLQSSCVNFKNELVWDVKTVDSLTRPKKLFLHYRPFSSRDSLNGVDTLRLIDNSTVYGKGYIWVVSGGFYTLSYFDKKRQTLIKSEELEVSLCAAYDIPEEFNLNTTKVLKPIQVTNIDRIELTIFSSFGEEVFSTSDPAINWDGRNKSTGLKCEPGNYFYNCDIYERKGNKTNRKNLTGVIELIY